MITKQTQLYRSFFITIILGMIFALASPRLCLAENRPNPSKPRHRRTVPIPSNDTPSTGTRGAIDDKSLSSQETSPRRRTAPRQSIDSVIAENEALNVTVDTCRAGQPIETFVQIASSSSPQAGSQGVFFISDMRESPQVFYLEKPGAWPQQISFFPDGIAYYRVSPNGEKLLLATHVGGDEQYNIHLLENKTNLTPLLVDRTSRVESVAWSADSTWFAYTSNARNKVDFDLYRYDLSTRQSTKLADLQGLNTVSDVSTDSKSIAVTNYRSISDSDALIWSAATKSMVKLSTGGEKFYDEATYFTKDSKSLFVLSDRQKGIQQAYLVSLSGSHSAKLLTSGNWPIEDVFLSKNRTRLAFGKNEEGYTKLEGYQIDAQGNKGKNISLPPHPKSIIRSVSFALNNDTLFFNETNSQSTSDIWSWGSGKKKQWSQSTHGLIKPECFADEELIHYPSFDQKQIPGFLFLPRGLKTKEPIPFIVHVHGGPESQYRPTFSRIFQYFLQRGFGILALNIRGSTGYGREYTDLDNYKLRMDSVKDVVEGAKWLIEKRYAKPDALAIYGGSYGGFLVLRTIQVAPDLFAAASESVGIANFVTFLQNTKPYRRALREVEYGPLSDTEFLKSISPMEYLGAIKTPLMIFHGANDPRVPVNETEQIVEALKKRDIPVDYKIFSDEGHGNAKLRNIMEQARLMAHFFEKQISEKKSGK